MQTSLEKYSSSLKIIFEKLDILTKTYSHPPVFTVEEAEEHIGHLKGGHCKSLFVSDRKKFFWLIVAIGSTKIDLKSLRKHLKAKNLSFCNVTLLEQFLGVQPGSVTPFGLMNDKDCKIEVLLDKKLFDEDILYYHPLTNKATTAISPNDLVKFIEHTNHKNTILDFDELEPSLRS